MWSHAIYTSCGAQQPVRLQSALVPRPCPCIPRLTVTNTLGDLDANGDLDEIYVFGARSFSVWDLGAGGSRAGAPEAASLAYDSGNDLEARTRVGQVRAGGPCLCEVRYASPWFMACMCRRQVYVLGRCSHLIVQHRSPMTLLVATT